MTSPVVVPAPELNAKFDPRTGNTGNWLGSDVARSVPLNDAAGRMLWIFADTYWADGDTVPGSRSGSFFTNDSLAVQHGPDLATANVTFHQAPTASKNWFPVSGTHFTWPSDGIVIGDDLYVTGTRCLTSDPMGAEYGWTIHRVPNARTTEITSWVSTLLYESGDTGTRPCHNPYVQGGFVYAFAVKRLVGWLWTRWTLADFTGTGTQANVQYYTGAGWSTVEADAMVISANTMNADGSVFPRAVDGRWTIVDEVGPFPLFAGSGRVAAMDDFGNFPVAGVGGYKPPPPAFQVGDRVKKDGLYDADVLAVSGTNATIKFTPFWGGATETAPLSSLVLHYRKLFENPRHFENPLPPDYWTYAYRAHPHLQSSNGLIVSFVDNGVLAPPLDTYWPKFYRVLPPTVAGLSVTAEGLASWTLGGGPDRVRVRVGGGAWTELAATAGSHQLAGFAPGQAVEVQAIGIGGATSRSVSGVTDGTGTTDEPPKPPSSADWLIWPRNPNLSRSYDPLSGWTSLVLVERDNKPDTWVVSGPASALDMFGPGMGAVLDRDGQQITSGQVTSIRRWAEGGVEGMEVAFASDLSIFRLARPEQSTTMVSNVPKRFTKAYDTFTGTREDAILHYLKANIGGNALPDRRRARLRWPVSLGRGGHTSTSARFDEVGPLVQSLGEAGNLRVTIVHTEDAGGAWLDVKIAEAANLSADVRFGTSESTAAGLIGDFDYEIGAPTATRALVMGGGELQMRVGMEMRDPAAETLWGTVAETLVDQRQSDPLDDQARIGATKAAITKAWALVIKSVSDDEFLRSWVNGASPAKVANFGWSWLNGWDLVRSLDLPTDRLREIAREVEATIADDHPLTATVEAIADAWDDVRQLDDDIRQELNDMLDKAWADQSNEFGVAFHVINASTLLDQRINAGRAVRTSLSVLEGAYVSASASHWAARVAAVVLELGDAGREVLAERAGPTSVVFTPTLGPDLEYRRDVDVASRVGIDLPGLPPMTDKIREAMTTVSVESGQPTERVQVVVGTPDAPTTRTQQQTARALRELSQLKRSK